jgi:outer membrane receptor protein involved in Fe transport
MKWHQSRVCRTGAADRSANWLLHWFRQVQRLIRVRILLAILTVAGFNSGIDCSVMAQETPTRPLDRVEVYPPARRSASQESLPSQESGYAEPTVPDEPVAGPPGTSALGGTGLGSGMPSLSVVSDKSAITLSSAGLPSQVQVITSRDIERLNVRYYTDLFKQVPGVKAFTQGQGDVGFVISMRGFAGQHGKDTAIFVDGVPQNIPSVAQWVSGAADLAWLTPEVIERIEIIKGPFSALYGDYALAGVINIVTKNSQPASSLMGSGGSFGAVRGVGQLSTEKWPVTPYLVQEYYKLDGYRDNSQYRRFNSFDKLTMPLLGGNLSLRFNYYDSDNGGPGFLPIVDVRAGSVARTAAINTTDGVFGTRYGVVMTYAPQCEQGLYGTVYVEKYGKNRFGTYPPTAQIAMEDHRTIAGGRVYYNAVFGNVAALTAGIETRKDSGTAVQYNSVKRQWASNRYSYGLSLSNWAWFAQGQVRLAEPLKIVGGVRGDYFRLGVDSVTKPANSGIEGVSAISPKIGLNITPIKNFNLFANKGLGFRSPAATEMSPWSGIGRKNFYLELAKVDAWDMGFNVTLFDDLFISGSYYQTCLEREVRMVNGLAVNLGDSERRGFEVEGKFYASPDIMLYVSYAWVDAKLKNPATPGQELVTGVSEDIIEGGIEITKDFCELGKVSATAYYQYVSGPPFYADTSIIPIFGPVYDVYNFKVQYDRKGWSAFTGAKYQPREYSSGYLDIGINNKLIYDPQPLWDVMGGVSYTF